MRDSLLSLGLSHATLTEIFQWTWENNITEVTRASRQKSCVHDFMYTMIILLVWKDIYPSHPKVNSLQSLIEMIFFFSPGLLLFPVMVLLCQTSDYQWGFSIDVITGVWLTGDILLIFYESLHLFWLALCIIIAEEKNTVECNVCLTSPSAFKCSPSKREW